MPLILMNCMYLMQVLTVYPCTLSIPAPLESSGFMKQLVGVISLGLKVKVSCLKEAQSLLLLLQVVSAVCGVQSVLVENFGSALLRIGHVMLGDHVQGAVGRAHRRRRGRTGSNATLTDSRTDVASREFFEESCLASLLQEGDVDNKKDVGKLGEDAPSGGSAPEGRRGREDSISSNPLEDLSGKILASCLSILFQSIDRGRLEQQKPVIVSLLAAAVEGVDSTLLINLASSRCLKWVGHARSPLSLGEQAVVFSRISCHSMRVQRDCKQAILARFAAVSERIGELTCQEMKRSSVTFFDSSDHRLGILALLSPIASLRKSCMRRIFDHWGPSLSQRLEGLFSLDLSSQFHSQWPSILTCIALDAVHGLDLEHPSDDDSRDLSSASAYSNDTWLHALSSFALSNPASGHEICLTMLQAMWEGLPQKKRDALSLAIANNIIQAKHTIPVSSVAATTPTSCYTPRTIPQQLLLVFAQLVPTPRFPLEFLSCLGLSGCDGEAAPLLEAMVSSSTTNKEAKRARTGLLASLDLLEDRDMVRALLRSCSSSRVTDLALSLETYGRSDLAQSVVLRAISATPPSEGSVVNAEWTVESMKESSHGNKDQIKTQAHEDDDDTELWLCRWVQYAKELSDWSLLSTFAASAGVTDISIESAVTLGDWEGVKGLKTSSASLLATGGLKTKIFDCMLNLVERRYPEASEAISDATQIALYRWQQLPSANGSASCHRTMMSSLQRILELEEGRNMLLNAQGCSTARVLPDLSPSLGLWRDRLPDRAENMLQWDSLLLWRANLFAGVSRIFRGGPDDSRLAAVTDASWTTLQLVAAARRHGLCEVGLKASVPLQSLSTLDVTDAFSKVREQVLLCLSSRATDSTAGGLHIVNTTNLDFFGPDQRAEMFRLKGLCNWSLGNNAEAQDCFSRSVQLGGGKRGRDWLSWGHLCYDIWDKGTFKSNGDCGSVIARNGSDDLASGRTSRLQWCSEHAVSSIVCILKAVECDSVPAKMLLPRVLWIIECCYSAAADADSADNNDEEEGGRESQLTQLMEGFICQAQEIPSWNWLPYLSVLFNFLKRPGGELFVPLLKKMLDSYPQRIIAHLMKVEDGSTEETVSGSGSGHRSTGDNVTAEAEAGSQRVDDLSHYAKLTHGALWTRIGWLRKEILRASKPCMLERVVTGLKAICWQHMTISLHRLDEASSLQVKQGLLERINMCISQVETDSAPATSSLPSVSSVAAEQTQHLDLLQTVKIEFKQMLHTDSVTALPLQLDLPQGNDVTISKVRS
jgi:FAT domain